MILLDDHGIEKAEINLAKPEKALIDILYLTPARSGLFKSLPEVEILPEFSWQVADEMIKKISSSKRRRLVKERFDRLIKT